MSKTKYRWWTYAKNMIRYYPTLKAEYEELHRQSTTPALTGMPGGGDISRKTESTALRELNGTEQKEYDAVRRAIETTQRHKNARERLEIINLVYWRESHTLRGAALKVGYSYGRAKQFHNEFVKLVGSFYGFE